MCGWHVHMQITCEQCPDATCRENHQHRLSCKPFTWSWNETTQHSYNQFHSITSSCHSRKIVQFHADHAECCRWCAHLQTTCGWCADDMRMTYDIHHPNLQWSLTLVSSACHPHLVCTRFQPPIYFQSNSRATVLLKMGFIEAFMALLVALWY